MRYALVAVGYLLYRRFLFYSAAAQKLTGSARYYSAKIELEFHSPTFFPEYYPLS